MSVTGSKSRKLSSDKVREKRAAIELKYREAIAEAERAKEKALKALQSICPHTHSESGEGGSLDYWYECYDCGKN